MLEALEDDIEDENDGLVETLEEEEESVLMYHREDLEDDIEDENDGVVETLEEEKEDVLMYRGDN